ncbi:biotin/lipoyl-containing protein [Castellaniella sp.]|uniref:biotin/lipoyl-containing protein n=1 Tax=Castellaniella sp. TaxID=1955812 RepID=UPI003560C3B6
MSSPLTISVPELANDFQSGTLVAWRKAVGDTVQPGDVVAEIMTDKVNMEIESPHAGTVKTLLVEVDDAVDVGQDIMTLE